MKSDTMTPYTASEKARILVEEMDSLDAYDAATKEIIKQRRLGREQILTSIAMFREDVRQMRLDEVVE